MFLADDTQLAAQRYLVGQLGRGESELRRWVGRRDAPASSAWSPALNPLDDARVGLLDKPGLRHTMPSISTWQPMALEVGSRLGHYDVTALIGEGAWARSVITNTGSVMESEPSLVIKPGDKLLACHRRLFENDEPRYFTGEVLSSNDSVVKIRGYSHLRDLSTGHFARKGEIRTKVISVTSGTYILYALPDDASVDAMEIRSVGGKVELRGDREFRMDLTEYSVHHP